MNKIDCAIDKEAIRTGIMGSENLSLTILLTILLTDEEKEVFFNIEKYNDFGHYGWEFDGNDLCITYTEDAIC